jgi:hypothetical protein
MEGERRHSERHHGHEHRRVGPRIKTTDGLSLDHDARVARRGVKPPEAQQLSEKFRRLPPHTSHHTHRSFSKAGSWRVCDVVPFHQAAILSSFLRVTLISSHTHTAREHDVTSRD